LSCAPGPSDHNFSAMILNRKAFQMVIVMLLAIVFLLAFLFELAIENHRLKADALALLKENFRLRSVLPPSERNGFHEPRSHARGFGISSASAAEI
jgi:hypothetical protein